MESRISPSNALKVDAGRSIGRKDRPFPRHGLPMTSRCATSSSAWHGKTAMLNWSQSPLPLGLRWAAGFLANPSGPYRSLPMPPSSKQEA